MAAAALLVLAEGIPVWVPVGALVVSAISLVGTVVRSMWVRPAVTQAQHEADAAAQRVAIEATKRAIEEHKSHVGGELATLLRRADACDARHGDLRVLIARVEERQ